MSDNLANRLKARQAKMRETSGGSYIPSDERYQEGTNFIGKAVNALDYLDNISRSAIYGGSKSGGLADRLSKGLEYAGQAGSFKRYTDADKVKGLVGIKNVGEDDGKFQSGDLVDFVTSLGTDILTSPLTYASFGVGKVGQMIGKAGLGGAGKIKHIPGDKGNELLREAAGIQTAKNLSEPALGMAYGAGLSSEDDSLVERLGKIGAGAVSVPALKRVALPLSSRLLTGGNLEGNLVKQVEKLQDKLMLPSRDLVFNPRNSTDEVAAKGFFGQVDKYVSGPEKKILKTKADKDAFARFYGEMGADKKYLGAKPTNEADLKALEKLTGKSDPLAKQLLGGVARTKADEIALKRLAKPNIVADRWFEANGKLKHNVLSVVDDSLEWLKGSDDAGGLFGKLADNYIKKFAPKKKIITKDKSGKETIKELPYFESVTNSFKQVREVIDKQQDFVRKITKGYGKVYSDLDVSDQVKLADITFDLRQEAIAVTNLEWERYMKKYKKHLGWKGNMPEFGKMKGEKYLQIGKTVRYIANEKIKKKLPEIEKLHGAKMYNKVVDLIDANKSHMADMNRHRETVLGDAKWHSVTGIDSYIPVFTTKDGTIDAIQSRFKSVGKRLDYKAATEVHSRKGAESILGFSTAGRQISDDQAVKELRVAYHEYARREAKKFLSQNERQLIKDFKMYKNEKGFFNSALRLYDGATTWMKTGMLFGSMSWFVNNYWDNLSKAYVQGGVFNAIDVAGLGLRNKKLASDIKAVTAGNYDLKNISDVGEDLVRLGVTDSTSFTDIFDDKYEKFFKSPVTFQDGTFDAKEVGKLRKAFDFYDNFYKSSMEKTVGVVGSYVENVSKAITYKNALDGLKSSRLTKNMPDESLKQIAARTTIDTFFDYEKSVGYFERAVLKRMFPFYSFYKNNARYWAEAFSDVDKVGRINHVFSALDQVGDNISDHEQKGLPQYLYDEKVTKLGTDFSGTNYAATPMFSANDAIRLVSLSGMVKEFSDKLSPMIVFAAELATQKNHFTGDNLLPSDIRGGKAPLFAKGFSYYFLQEMIDKGLGTDDIFNVAVDRKGHPSTDSDVMFVLDKMMAVVPAIPFQTLVGQLSGSVGKVMWDRESVSNAMMNRLLPTKSINVTGAASDANFRRRLMEEVGN